MKDDIKLIEIKNMQKIIDQDIEDGKKSEKSGKSDIKTGIIEKCSFEIIPHMIVLVGEERIWLEGPFESFEGKKEDYLEGNIIEIKAKNVGTIGGNCDIGKIDNLPLFVADWIKIKR